MLTKNYEPNYERTFWYGLCMELEVYEYNGKMFPLKYELDKDRNTWLNYESNYERTFLICPL